MVALETRLAVLLGIPYNSKLLRVLLIKVRLRVHYNFRAGILDILFYFVYNC